MSEQSGGAPAFIDVLDVLAESATNFTNTRYLQSSGDWIALCSSVRPRSMQASVRGLIPPNQSFASLTFSGSHPAILKQKIKNLKVS